MTAIILDGKECAKQIRSEIREQTARLSRKPGLAVVLVGDNPASKIYVRNKEKQAKEVGFNFIIKSYPSKFSQEELEDVIAELNNNNVIDGFIVQLPLPPHINTEKIVNLIDPKKDVDGLTPVNQGKLLRGMSGILPATPRGIIELIKRNGIKSSGKHIVIVGRSNIVGKPLASLFLLNGEMGDATVTIAHSKTKNLSDVCKMADILVVAIGKPRFITPEFVKPGAVVIDVGINRQDDKIFGDVDFEKAKEIAGAITPVPGGIGPMTIAMLLQNTFEVFIDKN